MDSEKIINILDKRFARARMHYNNLLEDFHPEEIHDFRLEMKKLRAFFRLLNTDQEEKQLSPGKKMKSFYRITGFIRNLQIHKERINCLCYDLDISTPEVYLKLLNNEEAFYRKMARKAASELSFEKFVNQNLLSVPDKLRPESVKSFMQQKREYFQGILQLPVYPDEKLHEVRKLFKDVLYDWNYLGHQAGTIFLIQTFRKKEMETHATNLGEFHDVCVALDYFSPVYLNQAALQSERDLLNKLTDHLLAEREKRKNEIVLFLENLKKKINEQETDKLLPEVENI